MVEIKDVKLGTTQVNKIYCGSDLVFEKVVDTTAPTTTPRPVAGTYAEPQTVWLDVNEACDTYYTTDGSTPTTASTKYTDGILVSNTTTLKYFSVDLAGNTEAVKTTTYTISNLAPTTTISPSATVQNTIPFTITLTTSEAGATIYYKIGTGAQQTYSAPFSVNQTNVASTQILITYWSVGADATESQKTITYDTSGAIPAQSTLTATAGTGQVALSWTASQNATSYTVYRSEVSGTLGAILSGTQYMTGTSFTDTTVVAGTTYYYTIRSANYGSATDSVQKSATPTEAPAQASWRYLKIEGYGATESGQETTTRLVEFEAWEGATNRMSGLADANITWQTPNNTVTISTNTIKDGAKGTTANTYPYWWTATPNANVVIDFGASYPLTKLNYYGYSISTVVRNNRFRVLASNTNNGTDWTTIWDNSTGQLGNQPILPSGYEITL